MSIKKTLKRELGRCLSKYTKSKPETIQRWCWDRDTIIEFWMEGFNEDMDEAFKNLVDLYDEILHKDPYWHFFYEGHYSLVRCSMRFRDSVRKFFDKRGIQYKWPISNWTEGMYITNTHQERFKHLFHNFSMLVIEMYKNGDGDRLHKASDRIIHCFLNHALYLANSADELKPYSEAGLPIGYWEANMMSSLTISRSFYIGTIEGKNTILNDIKKQRVAEDKKEE